MFCCETAGTDPQDVEDLAVFVSQLAALGLDAQVHVDAVPDGLSRNAQLDFAPYLFDGLLDTEDRVILVGAHRLSDARLTTLRRLAGPADRISFAFGTFKSRQETIGATAKLSYVFGVDPSVYNLAKQGSGKHERDLDCPIFGVARRSAPAPVPRVLLVAPDLQDWRLAAGLVTLALSRAFDVAVLTDGKSKHAWTAVHGTEVPVYHYGELLPESLAERVDVCVSFVSMHRNYRLRYLIANLAVAGRAIVDATRDQSLARENDVVVRGPVDIYGLGPFLASEILPNLGQITRHMREAQTVTPYQPDAVLAFLEADPRPRRPAPGVANAPARVVMMPTNGIGLGHAQRCALIAAELDPARIKPVFAAFPSCTKLVTLHGFDAMPLIGRSPHHAQSHENDLANYLRLRALTADATVLVFDGGYVFDSVYRSILENRLSGIWIRRGLWQAGQDNSIALDREKAFKRVIVPSEAFDDLNVAYSHGTHLHGVGPIVQRIALGAEDREALRDQLAARFDRPFGTLVVSMLGAGVAADRGSQIQALCGMMERRPDVLHLVVVWPTSELQPAWFGWSNSRVVKTHHAGVLAGAADLCISAVGYNAFHEALYNRIPSIFIPQMGSFMDDQRARARAAKQRGLAGAVEPLDLMTLEREIGRFLDKGEGEAIRTRLGVLDLPQPGNAETARLIEEVTDEHAALDRDPVPHHAAGCP